MADKQFFRTSFLIIGIGIIIITLSVIFLVKEQKKRTDYDELTYDEFTICFDDDNYCYEIFTEDKMYTIRENQLAVVYDTETYIVIFDNNYKWQYNKAILFIGIDKREELENDK